ncbi:MAG: cellulase family glycosylhydrolase [Chitinophagales bacterium]
MKSIKYNFNNYFLSGKHVFILIAFLASCQKNEQKTIPFELLYATTGSNPGIYDQQGRYVILRGCNYNSLGDYWQGNKDYPPIKKYNTDDFKDMARFGMNCIRLVLSWSSIEPQRGVYNYSYIDSIKMAIEDAAKYQLYVLLDIHQDAWGKYIHTPSSVSCQYPNKGWDGAPEWATNTDDMSTCMTSDDFRESPPAVYHAFHNLWFNTDGIADNFVNMWKELVKHTCRYKNVMGYDIINEPGLGNADLNQEFDRYSQVLGKVVKGIRTAEKEAGGYEHIIVFEHTITWRGEKIPFIPRLDFTTDKNIVFSGHNYFTDQPATILSLEQGMDLFNTLSKLYQSAFFCGEWLYYDREYLNRFAAYEDAHFWGSTFWQWCAPPGDPHHVLYDGTLKSENTTLLIEADKYAEFTGVYNEPALKVLSRPYPRSINGKPVKLSCNPDNGVLHLEAKATDNGTTTFWINNKFGTPVINGTNAVVEQLETVNGGYIATVKTNGLYAVDISY